MLSNVTNFNFLFGLDFVFKSKKSISEQFFVLNCFFSTQKFYVQIFWLENNVEKYNFPFLRNVKYMKHIFFGWKTYKRCE